MNTKHLPILGARGAMQVNNNFDTMIARPTDSFLEVWKLTRDVGLSGAYVKCPIADRNTDMVQTGMELSKIFEASATASRPRDVPSSSNGAEILFSDPRIPVVLQRR